MTGFSEISILTSELLHLVPHRPPMVWVDQVIGLSENGGRGLTIVKDGELYMTAGVVRPSAFIEFIAQTYGFTQAVRLKNAGQSAGYQRALLAAVKDFEVVDRTPLRAGARLITEVIKRRDFGPVAIIKGQTTLDGKIIATGELKVFSG